MTRPGRTEGASRVLSWWPLALTVLGAAAAWGQSYVQVQVHDRWIVKHEDTSREELGRLVRVEAMLEAYLRALGRGDLIPPPGS